MARKAKRIKRRRKDPNHLRVAFDDLCIGLNRLFEDGQVGIVDQIIFRSRTQAQRKQTAARLLKIVAPGCKPLRTLLRVVVKDVRVLEAAKAISKYGAKS
jgi:hypothetical protein